MSNIVIGLTGGIGSGKTAASDRFASHGITIVDADIAARIVVEKDRPALAAIADHFGQHILTEQGDLNRPLLREKIFKSKQDKQWLEGLLHPLIRQEIQAQLEDAQSPYCIFASPLLIESGQSAMSQRVAVVDVPESLQITRTTARDNNSEAQVQAIMASQSSRDQRLSAADDVIRNDGTLEELHRQVDQLHLEYLALTQNS